MLINALKGMTSASSDYLAVTKTANITRKMFSNKTEYIRTVELIKEQIFSFRRRVIQVQFVIFGR